MRIVPAAVALAVVLTACSSASPDTASTSDPTSRPNLSPTTSMLAERSILALGDSYTEGTGIDPEGAWPHQLQRALDERDVTTELTVTAGQGWNTKRLHREISATPNDVFDEIILAIGANDVVRPFGTDNFREGLELLAAEITRRSDDDTQVTVLSIPDFRATPWGQDRLDRGYDIEGYNAILTRFATDLDAEYIDITTISGTALDDPALIAPDDLHFSEAMYALWVDVMISAGVGS